MLQEIFALAPAQELPVNIGLILYVMPVPLQIHLLCQMAILALVGERIVGLKIRCDSGLTGYTVQKIGCSVDDVTVWSWAWSLLQLNPVKMPVGSGSAGVEMYVYSRNTTLIFQPHGRQSAATRMNSPTIIPWFVKKLNIECQPTIAICMPQHVYFAAIF